MAESRATRKKRGPYTAITLTCSSCPATFTARRKGGKGRCKTCLKNDANSRARAAKYHQRPHYREKARGWRLATYYGISSTEFERLKRIQGDVCAICRTPPPKGQNLCVDHDHVSGRVRGLLCHGCNRSIGQMQDSPRTLKSAISYLLRHSPTNSWDTYFIQLAEHVATRSKDPSTQVGAVLVFDRAIISTGYNGFPRGVNDQRPERFERPAKYDWTIHAEENALLNAARCGIRTEGATCFVTPLPPCLSCAKALVQAGVKEVVVEAGGDQSRWAQSTELARGLLAASGVVVRGPE